MIDSKGMAPLLWGVACSSGFVFLLLKLDQPRSRNLLLKTLRHAQFHNEYLWALHSSTLNKCHLHIFFAIFELNSNDISHTSLHKTNSSMSLCRIKLWIVFTLFVFPDQLLHNKTDFYLKDAQVYFYWMSKTHIKRMFSILSY